MRLDKPRQRVGALLSIERVGLVHRLDGAERREQACKVLHARMGARRACARRQQKSGVGKRHAGKLARPGRRGEAMARVGLALPERSEISPPRLRRPNLGGAAGRFGRKYVTEPLLHESGQCLQVLRVLAANALCPAYARFGPVDHVFASHVIACSNSITRSLPCGLTRSKTLAGRKRTPPRNASPSFGNARPIARRRDRNRGRSSLP